MMKDITGYEGLYAITDNGEVWSYRNKKFLKKKENPNGYYYAELWRNNKGKGFRVNRLVAEAFIPNPNNYPCVNHKDENKLNNKVSNLEWCTHKYNNNYGTCTERMRKTLTGRRLSEEHRAKTGMCHLGKKHSEEHKRKAGEALGHPVECIETGERFRSSNYAQAMTGIHHINDCCKGNRKTAGKFHWKFVPKTGKHIDIYIESHDQALHMGTYTAEVSWR